MRYSHLLSELKLKHSTLSNRVIMGSMHTNLEEQVDGFERLAEFYRLRAEGGVGLIVTGGVSPNKNGNLAPNRVIFNQQTQVKDHQKITQAIKPYNTKICMQILHAGRYGYTSECVAPSAIQAPINMYSPRALSAEEIEEQIEDFVHCANLAYQAGYHGVEIMGSEGYLINQFICEKTNKRTDKWGGSEENRLRFPLEIITRIRKQLPDDFILIFRISLLDLVENGSNFQQAIRFAQQLEQAGIDILNTGVGWHESRVPTIASMVPPAAFSTLPTLIRKHITIPIVACNRINTPEVANNIIENEQADLVSMARPFLADSHFVEKAKSGNDKAISPCIACNQSCLDNIFVNKIASCLVNPIACHETIYKLQHTQKAKTIAVVGAGVAGCMFALYAVKRGHHVTLFEKSKSIGGQFNLAAQIPGKQDFALFLRHMNHQISRSKIDLQLNTQPSVNQLNLFDEVVIASGVKPLIPNIENITHPKVMTYETFISQPLSQVDNIVIIGSGGIGFDVASKIIADQQAPNSAENFATHWGIDLTNTTPGGLTERQPLVKKTKITMLQRKVRKPGAGLGPTSVWIHREEFKHYGVKHIPGVTYEYINEEGVCISTRKGSQLLKADVIVVCTGQTENIDDNWHSLEVPTHFIGGASNSKGLNAQFAIEQALKLATEI